MSAHSFLILLTLAALALAGCAAPAHNDADVAFLQQMVPHHRQAVEMADLAPGRVADPEVAALATAVRDAQGPEIARMTGLLADWDVAPAAGDEHAGMAGMMGPDTMDRLRTSSGVEFDRAWVEGMAAHHRGAVAMADRVLATGTSPEVRELASAIKDAQTREITQMAAIRARLG